MPTIPHALGQVSPPAVSSLPAFPVLGQPQPSITHSPSGNGFLGHSLCLSLLPSLEKEDEEEKKGQSGEEGDRRGKNHDAGESQKP